MKKEGRKEVHGVKVKNEKKTKTEKYKN